MISKPLCATLEKTYMQSSPRQRYDDSPAEEDSSPAYPSTDRQHSWCRSSKESRFARLGRCGSFIQPVSETLSSLTPGDRERRPSVLQRVLDSDRRSLEYSTTAAETLGDEPGESSVVAAELPDHHAAKSTLTDVIRLSRE